jgi:hypothetical protein
VSEPQPELKIKDYPNFSVSSMMPIRLFKASSFNAEALRSYYHDRPGLDSLSFAEQWQSLCADLLVGTDFWQAGLEESGRFEVFETVLNCDPLQKAWARENRVSGGRKDIVLAQAEAWRPEVFFSHDFETLDSKFRSEVRRRVPSVALIFGWDGIARNDAAFFTGCDLMLSCIPHVVDFYKSQGIEGELFPYSFHEKTGNMILRGRDLYPMTFAGSIQLKSRLHFQRAEYLYQAARKLPLRLQASGSVANWQWTHRDQRRRLRHFQFRQAWMTHFLGKVNQGALFGLPMFQFLADSGITLNIHIDAARGQASNMRLFEATGAGACLLTDWQEDLSNYFEPDVEVATYRSPEELIRKARFLMEHPEERQRIAKAGQARTLRDHTFCQRAHLLADIITRHRPKTGGKPLRS